MLLDDSVADRESQTGASTAGLGGKKRIKNPIDVFARNPRAGVHNFNLDAAIMRAGSHLQNATRRHGIPCVQKEVQEHLLQLVC